MKNFMERLNISNPNLKRYKKFRKISENFQTFHEISRISFEIYPVSVIETTSHVLVLNLTGPLSIPHDRPGRSPLRLLRTKQRLRGFPTLPN